MASADNHGFAAESFVCTINCQADKIQLRALNESALTLLGRSPREGSSC